VHNVTTAKVFRYYSPHTQRGTGKMNIFMGLTAAAALFLAGIAYGVMSMSPPEYAVARGAVVGTAMGVLITYALWTLTTTESQRVVLGVGILAGIVAFIGMPISLKWIDSVQQSNLVRSKEEEKEHPKYVGTISPSGPNVKFSTGAGGPNADLEIGDSGSILHWLGPLSTPMLNIFGSIITVESIDGQVTLTTDVRDTNGELVAELIRNEWMVAPPPKTWDRNYSKNAVEVIDPRGKVVIQVVALPDRVRLQGEWHGRGGDGVRLVKLPSPTPTAAAGFLRLSRQKPDDDPQITRLFVYPSALHLGELKQ
jgi:hypothetical protein